MGKINEKEDQRMIKKTVSVSSEQYEKNHQNVTHDEEINTLQQEINKMESLLKAKKKKLAMLEKNKLENHIDCIKPVTLLKRLYKFCQDANGEELDIIQAILSQSVR